MVPTAPPMPGPFAGKHILLVEDNPRNIEIALELLQDVGLHITTVGNGHEAIERVMSSQRSSALFSQPVCTA